MTRSEILETAHLYITQDRAATHGGAEDSFADIAAMWSIYLEHPVAPADVGMMMVLFKAVRFKNNPANVDNTIDVAGYSALAGEIASEHKA
jgi:hypothetical protein